MASKPEGGQLCKAPEKSETSFATRPYSEGKEMPSAQDFIISQAQTTSARSASQQMPRRGKSTVKCLQSSLLLTHCCGHVEKLWLPQPCCQVQWHVGQKKLWLWAVCRILFLMLLAHGHTAQTRRTKWSGTKNPAVDQYMKPLYTQGIYSGIRGVSMIKPWASPEPKHYMQTALMTHAQ